MIDRKSLAGTIWTWQGTWTGQVPIRWKCLSLWLLVLLIALSAFWHLGSGSLHDWDEAIYAQVSKEMNATGDWLRPHYEYKLWIDKPPLLMWSTALLFKVFGVSEFWARAASALAGAVVVVMTFVIAALVFNRATGLVSILILVTSFDFVKYERRGMTDVPLTMFTLIAVYGYIRLTEGEPRRWYSIAGACALAVMVKSIAALTAPVAMLLASMNDISGATRVLRSRHFVAGLLVAVAIAVPWHALMFAQYGTNFLSRYFGFQAGHALSVVQGNSGDQNYYLRSLVGGMLPWVYLLPFALALSVWENLTTRHRSLILLALVVVIFGLYQFSRTKLPYYIIPAFPALAILAARLIVSTIRAPRTLLLSTLLAGTTFAALRAQHLVLGLLVISGLVTLFILAVRHAISARIVAAATFSILLIMGVRGVTPLYREGMSPVAALAAGAASRSGADRQPMIVFSGLAQPAALFYSGRPILEAHSWADIGLFAGETPTRIIMAKQDLASRPADFLIAVNAEAGDLVYGWVWTSHSGNWSGGPRSRGTP